MNKFEWVMGTIISVAVIVGATMVGVSRESTRITPPQSDGYCYWKTLDAEDSIVESKPGVFEYQIYATTNGVEVWVPCK